MSHLKMLETLALTPLVFVLLSFVVQTVRGEDLLWEDVEETGVGYEPPNEAIEVLRLETEASVQLTSVALSRDSLLVGTRRGLLWALPLNSVLESSALPLHLDSRLLGDGLALPSVRGAVRSVEVSECLVAVLSDSSLVFADRCDGWSEKHVAHFGDGAAAHLGIAALPKCTVAVLDLFAATLWLFEADTCSQPFAAVSQRSFAVAMDASVAVTRESALSGMCAFDDALLVSVDSSQLCALRPFEGGFELRLAHDFSPLPVVGDIHALPATMHVASRFGVLAPTGHWPLLASELFPASVNKLAVRQFEGRFLFAAIATHFDDFRHSLYLTTVPMRKEPNRRRLLKPLRVGGGFQVNVPREPKPRKQTPRRRQSQTPRPPVAAKAAGGGRITHSNSYPIECLAFTQPEIVDRFRTLCLSHLWRKAGCAATGALNPDTNPIWDTLSHYQWQDSWQLIQSIGRLANTHPLYKLACLSNLLCEYALNDLETDNNIYCSLSDGNLLHFDTFGILGAGGQGSVKKASQLSFSWNSELQRSQLDSERVVVKFYKNEARNVDSFEREVNSMAMMLLYEDVNVPRLKGSSDMQKLSRRPVPAKYLMLSMQFLQNSEDLKAFVQHYDCRQPLHQTAERVAIQLLHDIGKVLEAFHRTQNSHCDIKPANVLAVKKEGDSLAFYLIDFGMTWTRRRESRVGNFMVGGTIRYMSPEQYRLFVATAAEEQNWEATIQRRAEAVDAYSLFVTVVEVFGHLCEPNTAEDADFCRMSQKMRDVKLGSGEVTAEMMERLWATRSALFEEFSQLVKLRPRANAHVRSKVEYLSSMLSSAIVRNQQQNTLKPMFYSRPSREYQWTDIVVFSEHLLADGRTHIRE